MDDPLSRGLPFEVNILWHQLFLDKDQDHHSLFTPFENALPELDWHEDHQECKLTIPDLGDGTGNQSLQDLQLLDSDVASSESDSTRSAASFGEETTTDDVWTLDLDLEAAIDTPKIRTWDSFESKSISRFEGAIPLSESAPSVYDAVLAAQTASDAMVLPQRIFLKALCNLAVGRASVFFQWSDTTDCFVRTIASAPISGYGMEICDSFTLHLIRHGSRFRKLKRYAAGRAHGEGHSSVVNAFRCCVGRMLDSLEDEIMSHDSSMQSLLQLQDLVRKPITLLATVEDLAKSMSPCNTDEDAVSLLSNTVHETVAIDNALGPVMRCFLETASAPWLERLLAEVGLLKAPALRADYQVEFEPPQLEQGGDSFGVSVHHSSSVMTHEDHALILTLKHTLKTLRLVMPQLSPLERYSTGPIFADRGEQLPRPPVATESSTLHPIPVLIVGHCMWADVDSQSTLVEELDNRMSMRPDFCSAAEDAVQVAVKAHCGDSTGAGLGPFPGFPLAPQLSPVETLRPRLKAHSQALNYRLLHCLFRDCRLLQHFELQRAYHLLGNGNFVARLSTALFSKDTQSARRRRGVAPTGETMGLRLGARGDQPWPPASSELQITLMGVLTETYQLTATRLVDGSNKQQLPGGISFSIRELPDDEIERVMDPESIFALDFLRLRYAPPAPLDAILTPATMDTYDEIFKFLLRVLRVLHVTTTQTWRAPLSKAGSQCAQQCRSFAMGFMSYIMDIGIAVPWNSLMSSLADVDKLLRDTADAPATTLGIDGLRKMQEDCLETMRCNLFLRRNQDKIRTAIEDVLTAVLKAASMTHVDRGPGKLAIFNGFQQTLTDLVRLLRASLDKPSRSKSAPDQVEQDVAATRLLLLRLDWNGFYDADE